MQFFFNTRIFPCRNHVHMHLLTFTFITSKHFRTHTSLLTPRGVLPYHVRLIRTPIDRVTVRSNIDKTASKSLETCLSSTRTTHTHKHHGSLGKKIGGTLDRSQDRKLNADGRPLHQEESPLLCERVGRICLEAALHHHFAEVVLTCITDHVSRSHTK